MMNVSATVMCMLVREAALQQGTTRLRLFLSLVLSATATLAIGLSVQGRLSVQQQHYSVATVRSSSSLPTFLNLQTPSWSLQ